MDVGVRDSMWSGVCMRCGAMRAVSVIIIN